MDDENPIRLTARPDELALVVIWRKDAPIGHHYIRFDEKGCFDLRQLASQTDNALPAAMLPKAQSVSLVICTRDRPGMLERCLNSLAQQSQVPDEVIVVDNASRDASTRKVTQASGAIYVHEPTPGLDLARNAGVRRVTSDIVVFADDDVVFHNRWIERIAAAFDTDNVMAVTGLVLPAELETRAQIIFETHWGFGRGFRRIDFDRNFFERYRPFACPSWEIGAGANMAFRKSVFEEIGFFDERLDVGAAGCSGDSEFWYRVLAAGWVCRYEPSAVVFHYHRRRETDLRQQINAYMRGHVAALLVQYERHRDWGCLRRVLTALPQWYAGRCMDRLRHGRNDANTFLFDEMRGALSGVLYYLRAPRPRKEETP